MDVFLEKIVARRKDAKDFLLVIAIIVAALVVISVSLSFPVTKGFAPIIIVGIIYVVYRLITSRNIEFEYAVTNGDLDIDKIISQRKRKRIFSASCKDFDVVAKPGSVHFTKDVKAISKRIEAVSSMDAPGVYFITLHHKGERTVLFFQPDERMLNSFKIFIPKKVFE